MAEKIGMAVGYGRRDVEPGMMSEDDDEKETSHLGDSSDASVVHRFDKTSYRQDLGKRQCACDACECGDSAICIRKRCSCCTVST
jgi:hypothetical protein